MEMAALIVRNDEVVGSSPTSSTIFSTTCKHSVSQSCHTLSHKHSNRVRGLLHNYQEQGGYMAAGLKFSMSVIAWLQQLPEHDVHRRNLMRRPVLLFFEMWQFRNTSFRVVKPFSE